MKPGAGQGSPLRVAPPVQKILRRTLSLSGARHLHHDGRVMETAFLLGRGRGAGDLGGQGQGGLWLRQERAGGTGGGWVAAVVVGRGGAGCVSCCVCFLRRGGRCPCRADRRRGCPVLGQGGDMPVIVHVVFFVLKTVEIPQLQLVDYSDQVVDISVVVQRQIPMVLFRKP